MHSRHYNDENAPMMRHAGHLPPNYNNYPQKPNLTAGEYHHTAPLRHRHPTNQIPHNPHSNGQPMNSDHFQYHHTSEGHPNNSAAASRLPSLPQPTHIPSHTHNHDPNRHFDPSPTAHGMTGVNQPHQQATHQAHPFPSPFQALSQPATSSTPPTTAPVTAPPVAATVTAPITFLSCDQVESIIASLTPTSTISLASSPNPLFPLIPNLTNFPNMSQLPNTATTNSLVINDTHIPLPALHRALIALQRSKTTSYEMATKLYDKLQSYRSTVQKELKVKDAEQAGLNATISALRHDMTALRTEKGGVEKRVTELEEKCTLFVHKLQEKETLIEFFKRDENGVKTSLISKIDTNKQILLDLEDQLEQKDGEITRLTGALDKTKSNHGNELTKMRADHASELATRDNQITSLENEVHSLSQLQDASKMKMKEKMDKMAEKMAKMAEKLQKLESEQADCDGTLRVAQEKVRDLKLANTTLKQQREAEKLHHTQALDAMKMALREAQNSKTAQMSGDQWEKLAKLQKEDKNDEKERFKTLTDKCEALMDELKQSKKENKRLAKQQKAKNEQLAAAAVAPAPLPVTKPTKSTKAHNTYALTHHFDDSADTFEQLDDFDQMGGQMDDYAPLHNSNDRAATQMNQQMPNAGNGGKKNTFLNPKGPQTAQNAKIQRLSTIYRDNGMISEYEDTDCDGDDYNSSSKNQNDAQRSGLRKNEKTTTANSASATLSKHASLQHKTTAVLGEVETLIASANGRGKTDKATEKPPQSAKSDTNPTDGPKKRKSVGARAATTKAGAKGGKTAAKKAEDEATEQNDDLWAIPQLDDITSRGKFTSNDALFDDLGNLNTKAAKSTKMDEKATKQSKGAKTDQPRNKPRSSMIDNDMNDDDDDENAVEMGKAAKKQRVSKAGGVEKPVKATKAASKAPEPAPNSKSAFEDDDFVQLEPFKRGKTAGLGSKGSKVGHDDKQDDKAVKTTTLGSSSRHMQLTSTHFDDDDDLDVFSNELGKTGAQANKHTPSIPSTSSSLLLAKKTPSPTLFAPKAHTGSLLQEKKSPTLTTAAGKMGLTSVSGGKPAIITPKVNQSTPPVVSANSGSMLTTQSKRTSLTTKASPHDDGMGENEDQGDNGLTTAADGFSILDTSFAFSTASTVASLPAFPLHVLGAPKPTTPTLLGGAPTQAPAKGLVGLNSNNPVGSSALLGAKRVIPMVTLGGVHMAPKPTTSLATNMTTGSKFR